MIEKKFALCMKTCIGTSYKQLGWADFSSLWYCLHLDVIVKQFRTTQDSLMPGFCSLSILLFSFFFYVSWFSTAAQFNLIFVMSRRVNHGLFYLCKVYYKESGRETRQYSYNTWNPFIWATDADGLSFLRDSTFPVVFTLDFMRNQSFLQVKVLEFLDRQTIRLRYLWSCRLKSFWKHWRIVCQSHPD